MKSAHFQVVIVGGGTGGMMTASQILKKDPSIKLAIIDPAEYHYYQAAWTLVGAGTYEFDKTKKSMSELIPKNGTWLQEKVERIDPVNNMVYLSSNDVVLYDFLVLSPGLVYDYSLIQGLEEALHKDNVVSNYLDPDKTWKALRQIKGGNIVYTQPKTPIKCGGAPQKAAYMGADYLRKKGLLKSSNVILATPGTVIFGIKVIADSLNKAIARYGIHFRTYYQPVKIDSEKNTITFRYLSDPSSIATVMNSKGDIGETQSDNQEITIPYNFLHIAPPQKAPEFITESGLDNQSGWIDVDKHSLQHTRYTNIFGIGDAAGLPTAKTGAAIRKQVPVVVDNVIRRINKMSDGTKSYNGYSSCPLVTGYGKMVLAEFDYDNNFTPDPELKKMLIFDSAKEHWRLWVLKKYILPYLYWHKMMKGIDV